VETPILLSILGYEEELQDNLGSLQGSPPMKKIRALLGGVQGVHIDMIRPPFSVRPVFREELVRELCKGLDGTPLEIHLMALDPMPIFRQLRGSWSNESAIVASVHAEAFEDAEDAAKALRAIRGARCVPGIAIDLPTPVDALKSGAVGEADIIHVMSVPAGRGGQRFHRESLSKISRLKEAYPSKLLEVDGGINRETGRLAVEVGADKLVVGSGITGSSDPLEAIESLKKGLEGLPRA